MRTLASFALALVVGGCAAGRAEIGPGRADVGPGRAEIGPATAGVGVGAGREGIGVGVSGGVSAVTPNQMRIEWQPETRGDRTRVTGYVYNDYVLPARDIVLLVEGLDAAGQVRDRTRAHVDRVLTPGNRSYWEASLPGSATAYRVSVASLHWISSDR
jgi:hypothetical protein